MTKKHLKIALYLRVSTSEQTTKNQRRELEKWSKAAGHDIVAVYEDAGISGAKGRDCRPQFDLMLKDAVRRDFDLLAAWSVDRLGRSLQDLVATLGELHAAGVGLFLHQQAIDTTTPAGKAMFQMLGVFAEFEHTIIQERVKAGLSRAREHGTKSGKPFGRPQIRPKVEQKIRAILAEGHGIRKTAGLAGAGVGTVHRIKRAMDAETD
jgi:DNA invertase Pin-like site-specific DNA recombinase